MILAENVINIDISIKNRIEYILQILSQFITGIKYNKLGPTMLPTPVAPLLGCELFDSSYSGLPPLSSSTNIYSSFLPQVHSFNESVTHISLTANARENQLKLKLELKLKIPYKV